MSGFGGFGQNTQSTGFGGFGANNNNNTTTGFGTGSSFGGSTLFGSNNAGSTGGFGSGGTGGFGAATTNASPFGQNRPAFGAPATTTSGSLFGSTTATAGSTGGFGGFGNTNNNTSGGGLFGAQKPAFGGGSLFGSSTTPNTGFSLNSNQQSSAFPISSALGGNNAECQGTGNTPFTAFTEKEATGGVTNHFQSISFMQPYKNFSFEELRLADYNQGRRFGNGSGQAGAFGQSNFGAGFGQNTSGGFGQPANNTGGGLFGQPAATSSPFGTNQPAQSGFGTGGSLFGNKPATNLFGAASTSQPTGGLFGTAGATGGGFGSTGGGFGSGGSNLFGGNNQQNQTSKPPLFGSTPSTTGGFGTNTFGSNSATGGGLFGSTNNNTPFGQQQQQPAQSNPFGAFGQQNQNQTNNSPFSGFGQQQQDQKPGGLFGQASNTGSNPFGNLGQNNNQQQSTGGGLFGSTNNNQASGTSLFGKPATTGSNIFGNANANNSTTGGSLFSGFGNNNNANPSQQNQTSSLFGNTNNQQQKAGNVFGNSSNTGGGLFGNLGNNNNQQGGSSLFGQNNQQQQQPGSIFGNNNNNNSNQGSSLFGSQQQPQVQQQPNAFSSPPALNASLMDPGSAYGSPSIFSGLPPPPVSVGPIATPINVKQKLKKSAILPHYKMSPQAASRLVTPQKRGYGFTYSTYGTPGSAISNASTPGGLGSSLLFGSVGRGLGKSLSTSNLRRNFDSDGESILTPGAFSAGSSRYGGPGSLKRLTIDRSLRTDLFGDKETPATLPSLEKNDQSKQPGILKKKVSFDASTVGGNGENANGAQVNGTDSTNGNDQNSSATPSAEEQGFLRTPSRGQGRLAASKPNGVPTQPEMEQVRGNELAIVHEDESPESSSAPTTTRAPSQISQEDQQPGAYWMKPSAQEIQNMTQEQKRSVSNFSVGREGCGRVEFNLPVDLTQHPLEDICGKIVHIELRSLTVYPDQSKKPTLKKGLNVPSTLYLENSWPRQRDRKTPLHEKSGPRFNKHVDRLRKVSGTEFVRYEKDTGTWVFKVPHFTTYGFDYDDDASVSEFDGMQSSMLSEAPETPTPKTRENRRTQTATASTQRSSTFTNESSATGSSPDDTFQFRKKKMLPGAFDEEPVSDDDQAMQELNDNDESFLDDRLAVSPSDSCEDEPSEMQPDSRNVEDRSLVIRDSDSDMEMEMAGSFPATSIENAATEAALKLGYDTPTKPVFSVDDDWAEALQRTISPRKQDRQALRETQAYVLEDQEDDRERTPKVSLRGTGPAKLDNHIDLMKSLWGQEQARKTGQKQKDARKEKGLKWPYSKRSKTQDDAEANMDPKERAFHASYKPSWGPGTTLIYSIPGKVGISQTKTTQTDPILKYRKSAIVSEGRDIRFAKIAVAPHLTPQTLIQQRAHTTVLVEQGVPMAKMLQTPFGDFAAQIQPDTDYEKLVWQLASILFDEQDPEQYGVPAAQKATHDDRIRKDRLIAFWERICEESATSAANAAPTTEECAVAHLSGHNVAAACDALIKGKDFRLATLVAQIGGDEIMREDMENQIEAWRELNVLSEMTEPIRTLYAFLAGNTSVCEGKKGSLEDRARTFLISERFNLDWKRAFGLRLYYAILAEEPIQAAVVRFNIDLQCEEPKQPIPWFLEASNGTPWHDRKPNQREDILWGLLKLYAASKSAIPLPSIAETFAPYNTTGNPLDARLSFQLYHALTLRFPTAPEPAPFQADALIWTFATQLDGGGESLWALFALLHLHSPEQRHMAIQAHLAHHAADIKAEPGSQIFQTLIEDFQIPPSWIFEAKALYARNVLRDPVSELGYLIKAGDVLEAHEVLRKEVGPMTVIEEDWGTLGDVLDAFADGKRNINEWGLGGQVYEDYLALIFEEVDEKGKAECLERLVDALPTMARGGEDGFREMVAMQEISGVVGKEILAMKEKDIEAARILQLPLTEDKYLMHTMELSLQYYKSVMAGGR